MKSGLRRENPLLGWAGLAFLLPYQQWAVPVIPGPVKGRDAQKGTVPMTSCANIDHGHYHRPQLQQDQGLRHGPGQQFVLDSTIATVTAKASQINRP